MNVTKVLKSIVATATAFVIVGVSSAVATPPGSVATAAGGNIPLESLVSTIDNSLPNEFIKKVDKVVQYEDTQLKNKNISNLSLSKVMSSTGSVSGISTSVNTDGSRIMNFRIAGDNIKLVWNTTKSYGSYTPGHWDAHTPLGDFTVNIEDSIIHYNIDGKDITGANIRNLEKSYRGTRYQADTYIVSEGASLANPYEFALCSIIYTSLKGFDYNAAKAEQERVESPLSENELATLANKFGAYTSMKTAINPANVSSAIGKLASSTDLRDITVTDALNGVGGNTYKFVAGNETRDNNCSYYLDGGKHKSSVDFKVTDDGNGYYSPSEITLNTFYTDGRKFYVTLDLGYDESGNKVINAKFKSGDNVVEKQYTFDNSKTTTNDYCVRIAAGEDARVDSATVSAIARLLIWTQNDYIGN